jgi:hypothetical protein
MLAAQPKYEPILVSSRWQFAVQLQGNHCGLDRWYGTRCWAIAVPTANQALRNAQPTIETKGDARHLTCLIHVIEFW